MVNAQTKSILTRQPTGLIILIIIVIGAIIWAISSTSKLQTIEGLYQQERSARENAENQVSSLTTQLYSKTIESDNLRAQLSSKEMELSDAQQEISSANSQLISVRNQLQSAQNQISELQTQIEEQQLGMYELSREVGKVEQRILSLETFVSENTYLPSAIAENIYTDWWCGGDPITLQDDTCYIDTCKMGKFMQCRFKWVDDITTSGDTQSLFDVWSFWNGKIGDCDDFAFFTSAWLRSEILRAKQRCTNVLVSVKNKDGLFGSCGSAVSYIKADIDDIYDVCGCFGSGGCHCEVGIFAGTNNNPYQSNFFAQTLLFEPQNGAYQGKSNEEFDAGIGWLFSYDTYYDVNSANNQIDSSLKSLRQDLEQYY